MEILLPLEECESCQVGDDTCTQKPHLFGGIGMHGLMKNTLGDHKSRKAFGET